MRKMIDNKCENYNKHEIEEFYYPMVKYYTSYMVTEALTDLHNFFQDFTFETIPYFETSKATNMNCLFYNCLNLKTIPLLNTSNVADMSGMFQNCSSITTIPRFDTSNVTNMLGMFYNCSSLTNIPNLDTSNVTNMDYLFYHCSKLKEIPAFDVSKVTTMTEIFSGCVNLTTVHCLNINANLEISPSTRFTREALLEILGNLKAQASGVTKTLTMGATNLAKLSDSDKAIATSKGWTLA